MSRRTVVGVIWVLAAMLCALVIGLDPMSLWEPWTWSQARSEPEMAQGLALVAMLGLGGLAGLFWRRLRGEVPGERQRQWDGDIPAARMETRLATAGVVLMVLGIAIVAGDWLSSHRALPAGELILPMNAERETYVVRQGDRNIEVMLPLRMMLRDVQFGDEPTIGVQFFRPNQDRTAPQEFWPARTLDVEGLRFGFSGFAPGDTAIRAVVSSSEEDTIADAGVPGDRIRFSIDGPRFRIVEAAENYLDVMGPAVQLEDQEGYKFWVFQRASSMEDPPAAEHSLRLEELQSVPAATMTVTAVRPFWPFGLGVSLFIIGFALLFFFSERRFRGEDGEVHLWSLNAIEVSWSDDPSTLLENRTSLVVTLLQLGALGALGASLYIAQSVGGLLLLAGAVALLGLPRNLHQREGRALFGISLAIPLGLAVMGLVVGGFQGGVGSLDTEAAIWTAQLGSWAAMATALLGAGVAAERTLRGRVTSGSVTVALIMWAAAASVLVVGMQRGAIGGFPFGFPLVSDGAAAVWSIPGITALSSLEIPVVADGSWILGLVAMIFAGSTVAVGGALLRRKAVAASGWLLAGIGALVAAVRLLRADGPVDDLNLEGYEAMARQWLQFENLPPGLAARGQIASEAVLEVDSLTLMPEIGAFLLVVVLAIAMVGVTFFFAVDPDGDESSNHHFAGRDLFVRALMFGFMGWVLGLVLTWERLGAAGVLAPMEWLGLSAPLFGLGLLILGWRRGPSPVEKFIGVFGPALAVAYLIVIIAVGAAAGVVPGASIGF